MKKITYLLIIAGLSISLLSSGQVPQMIDFQGMARDDSGNPLTNVTISARMSVYEGPLPGVMVYSEMHYPQTNSYGLFHLMIGDGAVIMGNFSTINWASGNFFIQTEIDPNGGNNFVDMGMSKLATVPFAFYAAESGSGGSLWQQNGSDIYYNDGWVGIGTDVPEWPLHIHTNSGPSYVSISDATGGLANGLRLGKSGNGDAYLLNDYEYGKLHLGTDGTYDMVINEEGMFGVGMNLPLVRMHVKSENSPGANGTDLGVLYSTSQDLAPAVFGYSEGNTGDISYGVFGHSYSNDCPYNMGVFAEGGGGFTNNYGLYATDFGETGSNYSIAVYGDQEGTGGAGEYAGYFSGDVEVTGTLSKGGGSFKIDHPQDPANKYLYHSFVESPDMMNIYNGNVTTGARGYAEVTLPAYFESLNMDFRYQLTVIGEFAQAIVKEEISGSRFTIQTDKPNVKVSWQVTGIRKDPWAQANRIQTEVEKTDIEKGRYLHPELYGKSREMGLATGLPHR
ncbi:MAG: hypothetical protein R6T99_06510 [Bacteroidales bacterium]